MHFSLDKPVHLYLPIDRYKYMDEYLVFKAIGDRVRIDILKFLSGGEKSVGEVVAINVNTVEIANGLSGLDAWEE